MDMDNWAIRLIRQSIIKLPAFNQQSAIRLLQCVVCALLIGAAPAAQQNTGSAPVDAWRQFRGSQRLTGVSTSMPPASLKVLWTFNAGEVVDSSAAIVDGVVYIGGGDGDLFALDLATGKQRWKYSTGNIIGESSVAVANGAAFIGDLGGIFHAVNIKDGKALWTFKTGSEIKSSPVVVRDVVLVGSYDGHLYGLDAKTGKPRWKVQTEGQVHATP